jgi:hypothetical protein
MKVDIPVVNQEYCLDIWWETNDIFPTQICAGEPGKDSCNVITKSSIIPKDDNFNINYISIG